MTPDGRLDRQKYRLVVEGPPNWTHFREFWKMFADEGAVVVASTYYEGRRHLRLRLPARPVRIRSGTLADYCSGCYTNLNLPSRVDMLAQLRRGVRGRRIPHPLGQVLQLLLGGAADDAARGREAHGTAGSVHRVGPRGSALLLGRQPQEPAGELLPDARCAARGRGGGRRREAAFVGIDLGSTTTKAVVLDERGEVLGRGITNSRSNYDLAAELARTEAFVTRALPAPAAGGRAGGGAGGRSRGCSGPSASSRCSSSSRRLEARIEEEVEKSVPPDRRRAARRDAVDDASSRGSRAEEEARFAETESAPSAPTSSATRPARPTRGSPRRLAGAGRGVTFDLLVGLYDKCIVRVENEPLELGLPRAHRQGPRARRRAAGASGRPSRRRSTARRSTVAATVGTGYGRARLPFPKEQIRSEILCHGLGAHVLFPETRTVLDIGGQDTKAIQVDGDGNRHELPDERPLRRRLRPLPRLHRRRDEHGPARARAAGARRAAGRSGSTRPARSSRGRSCASGFRSARSARTSWPGSTAPSSCAR